MAHFMGMVKAPNYEFGGQEFEISSGAPFYQVDIKAEIWHCRRVLAAQI